MDQTHALCTGRLNLNHWTITEDHMFVSFSNPSPQPYPEARPSLRGGWEQPGRHLKPREEENLSLWNEKLGKRVLVVKMGRGDSCCSVSFFSLTTAPCRWTSPGRCKTPQGGQDLRFPVKGPGKRGSWELGVWGGRDHREDRVWDYDPIRCAWSPCGPFLSCRYVELTQKSTPKALRTELQWTVWPQESVHLRWSQNSTSKSLRTELTAQRAGWDLRLQPNWVDFLIKLTNKNQCSSEYFLGLVRWLSGKESSCSCRRHKRWGFDPWIGNIPWRRKWQPTSVFSPEQSHGQRNLAGYSLERVGQDWAKELDRTELLSMQQEYN